MLPFSQGRESLVSRGRPVRPMGAVALLDLEAFTRDGFARRSRGRLNGRRCRRADRRPVRDLGPGGRPWTGAGRVYASRNLLGDVARVAALAGSEAAPRAGRVRSSARAPSRSGGLLFDKTPEANWTVPWHQDLTIAVKARQRCAGVRPLDGQGRRAARPAAASRCWSGCSRSGSTSTTAATRRAAPRPARLARGGPARRPDETRRWLERVPAVACPVPSGGVLVMRPLILHASSPADAPGHRRVIHLEYAAEPLPGGVELVREIRPTRGSRP